MCSQALFLLLHQVQLFLSLYTIAWRYIRVPQEVRWTGVRLHAFFTMNIDIPGAFFPFIPGLVLHVMAKRKSPTPVAGFQSYAFSLLPVALMTGLWW
jgi:hypothetical protein